MTISGVIVLSVFLALFGMLIVISVVHLIQGMRYSGTTPAMASTSMLFIFGIVAISF